MMRLAFLLALLLASSASAQTAAFTAHRCTTGGESCPAPLAVHFDATATTCTGFADCSRPFHDLQYTWDFGDPTSGTWSTNGRSKNSDIGAVAAHVYEVESSATYTVTLTVCDTAGTCDEATATIYVDDPDTVWSGTNTECYSTGTDMTGCPSGAAQNPSVSSWTTICADLTAGKRVLLRRGDTWAAGSSCTMTSITGPGMLGAYGSGNKPILQLTTRWLYFNDLSDWRFVDIDLAPSSEVSDNMMYYSASNGSSSNLLWLRIDGTNYRRFGEHSAWPQIGAEAAADPDYTEYNSHFFIVDSTWTRTGTLNYHGYYGGSHQFVFMGNTWSNGGYSHSLRVDAWMESVISHNFIAGALNGSLDAVKIHCGDQTSALTISQGFTCTHLVMVGNEFDSASGTGNWHVGLATESGNPYTCFHPTGTVAEEPDPPDTAPCDNCWCDEKGQHLLVEANFFHMNNNAAETAVYVTYEDVTLRNNVFIWSTAGTTGEIMVAQVAKRNAAHEQTPANFVAEHNTAYRAGTPSTSFLGIYATADATSPVVRNNLFASPGGTTSTRDWTTGAATYTEGGNLGLATGVNPFVETSPLAPADLKLSSAETSATTTPNVFLDYGGLCRIESGSWVSDEPTVGAWGYSTATCGVTSTPGQWPAGGVIIIGETP